MATQRLVIVMAMEEESKYLHPYLQDAVELPSAAPGLVKTTRGNISGLTVDLVICGIGGVHAAAAMTATLLNGPPVHAVLSCGCAGAHIPEQKAGDLVLGKTVIPLTAEVVERSGSSRLAGVRWSMLDAPTTSFDANPDLLRVATEAAKVVCGEIAEDSPTSSSPRVDIGAVGSSDVWRQSPSLIAKVNTQTGSLCEEMEAHALAQICHAFGVPFLAIKDVANSEIHPEPIQLDPVHSIVPESCTVGLNACRVTARTVELLATDSTWRQRMSAGAAAASSTSGGKKRLRSADLEGQVS